MSRNACWRYTDTADVFGKCVGEHKLRSLKADSHKHSAQHHTYYVVFDGFRGHTRGAASGVEVNN